MLRELLFVSALLITFANVFVYAQSSQPFGVTGNITLPAASVTIANGGSANFGSLSVTAVKGYSSSAGTNNLYSFPVVTLAYSVTFTAPTKAALAFTDNNSGKVLPFNNFDAIRFGLIDGPGSSTIGSIVVMLTDTLMDNNPVSVFFSAPNGTTTWSTTTAGGKTGIPANYAVPGYTNAFAKTAGATVPDSFTTLSGNLSLVLSVSKTRIDNATTNTTANGSGIFTVVYL